MVFRNDRQRSAVCRALLARVGMRELWGPAGPDLAAQRRTRLDALPRESAVLVLTCWALWDGTGIAAVTDLFSLSGANLRAVGELLHDGALGPQGIDAWLERWSRAEPVPLTA